MRHQKYLHHLAGFRPLGLAFTLFSLANLAVFALVSCWPGLLEGLWLSADRPWGIVTSIFTHIDATHLFWNLGFFLLYCLLFMGVSWQTTSKLRRDSSRIFLAVALAAGIITNVIEFLACWYPSGVTSPGSWGASVVVFASGGALLAFSLHNIPSVVQKIQGARRSRKRIGQWQLFVALLPVIVIIWMFVCIQSGFGYGLAGVAHGLGFLLGFLMGMALWALVERAGKRLG